MEQNQAKGKIEGDQCQVNVHGEIIKCHTPGLKIENGKRQKEYRKISVIKFLEKVVNVMKKVIPVIDCLNYR